MRPAAIITTLLLPLCSTSLPFTNITTPPVINTNTLTNPPPNPFPTLQTLLIDTFTSRKQNDLGSWHGAGESLDHEYGQGCVRFYPTDPDQNYHTQFASSFCYNLLPYRGKFLHVVFAGTDKFTISLTQHNQPCDPFLNPYPATWDSVEAGRYTAGNGNEIYIPLEHFRIDLSRVVSVAFHGFYTTDPVTLYKVEIVTGHHDHEDDDDNNTPIPTPPAKLPSGHLILRCARPNSFAFGIDDGQPQLAQEIMRILEEERILVTFFVVGNGLRDPFANFSGVYAEMLRRGHQVALHSNSHPKMEALENIADIDAEIYESIAAFEDMLGHKSNYFRPPFGTVGARVRQRLAAYIPSPKIINWSVDVEDWLWTGTDTPERQLEAFTRDVGRGGNLVVMHYLSESTVWYFREMIHFVKAVGLDVMRVDQCLGDKESPPYLRRY